ncbi:hypothetical protein EMCRGX_G023886 [Ephydatia muelleri]
MAEVFDEFDEATPLRSTYCSRLTTTEYEDMGETQTEKALLELRSHLDQHPDEYFKILKRKAIQDAEESGVISFFTTKFWVLLGGEDSVAKPSRVEMQTSLEKLKEDMLKAHEYSQKSKGRRYSKRLAAKQQVQETVRQKSAPFSPAPPPPPPPPPPPSHMCATPVPHPLARRPLTDSRLHGNCGKRHEGLQQNQAAISVQKCTKKSRLRVAENGDLTCSDGLQGELLKKLKGSGERKRLRKVTDRCSPGGTPSGGWPKRRTQMDMMPYFNTMLLDKFKNTLSPAGSPTIATAAPSPQSFQ